MYLLELNKERDWDYPRRVLDMIYLISERRRHEIVALLLGKGTRGLRLSHIMTLNANVYPGTASFLDLSICAEGNHRNAK